MRTDYLRVTHPCATLLAPEGAFAFDLHVLSIPPAFVLSQDQTLQFNILTQSLYKKIEQPIGLYSNSNKSNNRPAHLLFSFQRSIKPQKGFRPRRRIIFFTFFFCPCQHVMLGAVSLKVFSPSKQWSGNLSYRVRDVNVFFLKKLRMFRMCKT